MKPVFGDERRETAISKLDRGVEKVERESSSSNMVTKEQAEEMALKAAEIATEKALTKRKERDDNEETGSAISSKTVKELQNIAGVFNALKEFSANPLQKAIEGKVGDVAAGVVERAFMPHQEPQKKDLIDQILNSQLAAGLGAGLGQRGPELVDAFTRNFGKEKVDGWISGAVNKRGGGGGTGSGISGIPGVPPPGVGGQTGQQSEIETVLGLDPNNPEHVAAYASSQGGMSVETARKVLMIHQDDFIKQLDLKGVNTTEYKLRRNQQIPNSSKMYRESLHGNESYSGAGGVGGIENVQEYREPPPRINDDLMTNTPITEDKRWEKETDNVELHPEMKRVEQERVKPIASGNSPSPGNENSSNISTGEIANYLKNLNDYVIGLKDMVEKQNNDVFGLRQEIDILKRDNMLPDDLRNQNETASIRRNNQTTTVSSMKTIKKGYNYVKTDKKDKVEG